jgi:hypothetical protein
MGAANDGREAKSIEISGCPLAIDNRNDNVVD